MRYITLLIGLLSIIGGIIFGILSYLEPKAYDLTAASAIQITQVYAMAQHYALLGILCMLFAIAIILTTSSPASSNV